MEHSRVHQLLLIQMIRVPFNRFQASSRMSVVDSSILPQVEPPVVKLDYGCSMTLWVRLPNW